MIKLYKIKSRKTGTQLSVQVDQETGLILPGSVLHSDGRKCANVSGLANAVLSSLLALGNYHIDTMDSKDIEIYRKSPHVI